jgi:hypothetical protein
MNLSDAVKDIAALPVLNHLPEPDMVCSITPDGAYFRTRGEEAQIIVVGPMHFSPGSYVEALNELNDDSYVLYRNSFLGTDLAAEAARHVILQRGFVNLLARRSQ